MTKNEALKLALEALEYIHEGANNQGPHTGISWRCVSNKAEPAITAIKEALAQPAVTESHKQEPVAHSVVAGALFDFMGWLTSRNKRLTLSGADEASPAVEAIQEFSEKRGLSLKHAEVGFWIEFLSTPPQRTWVGLTRDEILEARWHNKSSYKFARVLEAKLKEKNT